MSINCSECFRDCTARRILKARASAWRRCNASLTSTEAGCGRRGNWTRAPPSISPSVWEKNLVPGRVMSHTVEGRASRPSSRAGTPGPPPALERKAMEQRLEADYELRCVGHTVSGRQSGRYGSCPACAAAREAGKQHLRGARWRGSSGLYLLSRGVRAKIV